MDRGQELLVTPYKQLLSAVANAHEFPGFPSEEVEGLCIAALRTIEGRLYEID